METQQWTRPATKTSWMPLALVVGLCLLGAESDAHILVYRRLTNQLIGEYNDMPAQFGPSLPPNGLKVFGIPAKPIEACEDISPPPRAEYPSNAKFVAIIQRGGDSCSFELKVRKAQKARFEAVIVYNNEGDELEQMSAENSSGILIPSVFVGETTGMNLRSYFTDEVVLVVNDKLPFNINTQLILPFSILIGLCFLIMIFYMIYKCVREERRLRRYRLPKRMLKKLPILKYTKNNDLPYDNCVICLDDFVEGDELRVLPCKHLYHSHCIDPWLTGNRRVCPICKRKVFTKGEARSNRSRQSSLDSVTDTDDDTTPLLQSDGSGRAVAAIAAEATTTHHGTFRRDNNATSAAAAVDVTSDDENVLSAHQSPTRNQRVNPFDRAPNLPPHLAEQLSENRPSLWSSNVLFRLFRRQQPISIAAPPFLEEVIPDGSIHTPTATAAAAAVTPTRTVARPTASNNILNPNLSGSFKEDDELPHQSIYEPIAAVETNTAFIQTPTQGGIGVVALPNTNGRSGGTQNTDRQYLI